MRTRTVLSSADPPMHLPRRHKTSYACIPCSSSNCADTDVGSVNCEITVPVDHRFICGLTYTWRGGGSLTLEYAICGSGFRDLSINIRTRTWRSEVFSPLNWPGTWTHFSYVIAWSEWALFKNCVGLINRAVVTSLGLGRELDGKCGLIMACRFFPCLSSSRKLCRCLWHWIGV